MYQYKQQYANSFQAGEASGLNRTKKSTKIATFENRIRPHAAAHQVTAEFWRVTADRKSGSDFVFGFQKSHLSTSRMLGC
jgi:hypothetical protein